MRALTEELARATTLQMQDLERPYFVQYHVQDSIAFTATAQDGALVSTNWNRQRQLRTRVRVGSPELDNTNFTEQGVGFGDQGEEAGLPVEDDLLALRQAIWLATDRNYKSAVETLTRKRAYLRDKAVTNRGADFSAAPVVEVTGAAATLTLDEAGWQARLRRCSAAFNRFPAVQDSEVRFIAGAQNLYVVNSEGARLRMPDSGAVLAFRAELQAPDGMRLSDGRVYVGKTAAELPSVDVIERDIAQVVRTLESGAQAEVLDRYNGPVLFDGVAGAQLFRGLLGEGLAGKPEVVGEQRSLPGMSSLEYKLGTRLLPGSFQVWDDPTLESWEGQALLGFYRYDDEAVAAQRVELIKDGRLRNLCLCRTPTPKLTGSNGHGRSTESGAPRAWIGNLFIEDQKGIPEAELKAELIAAAKDEGLEYALRVPNLRLPGLFSTRPELMGFFNRALRGGGAKLGDPVVAYKVSVTDGKETPVRGLEFAPFELRGLRHVLAAGATPRVFNDLGVGYFGAAAPVAVVAPPVLLEEVELARTREEFDTPPLLAPPASRPVGGGVNAASPGRNGS